MLTLTLNLFNNTQSTLTLAQSTLTQNAVWQTAPPASMPPNSYNTAKCTSAANGNAYDMTLVYKPDQIRLLTTYCGVAATTITVADAASPGYRIGLAPQNVPPDFTLAINYWPAGVAEEADDVSADDHGE